MNHRSPQQHEFLKQLLAAGGGAFAKELKQKLSPKTLSPLMEAKFIGEEMRGRSRFFVLTDSGRAWINEHPEYVPQTHPFTTKQRFFLMQLVFIGGSAASSNVSPAMGPKDRRPLLNDKLLEVAKGPKRSQLFSLTDAGWKWAEEHLTEFIQVPGPAAAVLHKALVKIHDYLSANDLRLADLIRAKPRRDEHARAGHSPTEHPPAEIEQAIAAACLRLGDGREGIRLRLADVRKQLSEFDRASQDGALLRLIKAGSLVLYGMDDPREIREEDREAQYNTPSGEPRHLVYWTGSQAGRSN